MTAEPQLTRSVDDPEGASISIATRLRRAISVPGRMVAALFVPDRFMPRVVFGERSTAAVLTIMLCAGLSAFVLGSRIDMTRPVLQQEAQMMKMMGPDAEPRSDRAIQEQIDKDTTIAQVTMGLSAGAWVPLQLGLLAIGLYLLGRYVGGKPTMRRAMAAASYGSLPSAVKSLVVAGMAWPRASLAPMEIEELERASMLGRSVLGPMAVDAFALWTVILLGFGLASASSISRRRSFIAIVFAFTLFQLWTGSKQ